MYLTYNTTLNKKTTILLTLNENEDSTIILHKKLRTQTFHVNVILFAANGSR